MKPRLILVTQRSKGFDASLDCSVQPGHKSAPLIPGGGISGQEGLPLFCTMTANNHTLKKTAEPANG